MGYIDLATGKFEAVAFCPGYLRGLAFWSDYAIVGLSKPRDGDKTFSGLPLDELLKEKDTDPRCGLMVVDLNTGAIVHWLRFEGIVTELYDLQVLPGVKRPMALGFQTEEIAQLINLEPMASLDTVVKNGKKLLVIAKHDNGGFFSNFNKVLQWLEFYKQDYDFRVNWTFNGSEAAFRYGDGIGENIWDLFFEPLPFDENYQYVETIVQDRYLDYAITHVNVHQVYLDQNFGQIRQLYHQVYQQYIKVKPDILKEVNEFYTNYLAGNVCLGVHKRHLLHYREEYSKTALTVRDYLEVIEQLLSQSGATKIFLATDEEEAVGEMKKAFGDRLICRPHLTRASVEESQEMHWQAKNSGSRLGREVLIDALLLAKCDLMLHGVSNISTAIAFINPHLEMVYLYADERGNSQVFSPARTLKIEPKSVSSSVGQGFGNKIAKKQSKKQKKKLKKQNNLEDLAAKSKQKSDSAQVLFNRSQTLKQQGNLPEAEVCLREAIRLQPDYWLAYNNLGTLLQNQGNIEEAKLCYEKVLQFNPNLAETISNLASIWQLAEDWEKAKTAYYRAIQLKPDYLPAHFNLANIFREQKRLAAAVEHYQKVIALDSNYTEAYFSLATIYEYRGNFQEALNCYQKVDQLEPNAYYVKSFISYIQLKLCNWENYQQRVEELIAIVEAHLVNPKSIFNPWSLSAFPVPLQLHQAFAQTHAQEISLKAAEVKQRLQFKHRKNQPQKLRIGYISPDFREHAVGRLVHKMFPYHHRDRFEIYCYSTVDVEDAITREVKSGCDVFVDLSPLSREAAARRIYGDGIHIIIDLAGYTIGNGSPILALQPAPIQAQWLGYPDTMGAEFIQYYLADKTLITTELAQHYTEEIIYLPHAFVASPLTISQQPMTRSQFGLPEDGFVFCCFNSHYKITPELFDVWMAILEEVPHGVLWLSSGAGMENLRSEAKSRGCDPARLIFADKIAHEEYLARYALADLCLDTSIYNAGSTAAAVLWTGLPLLTCAGHSNASRMGASICAAAGLEENICSTVAEYQQRAVYLANNPEELTQMRQELQEKLKSEETYPPLFQVEQFVRSLESAFQQMWQKFIEEKC